MSPYYNRTRPIGQSSFIITSFDAGVDEISDSSKAEKGALSSAVNYYGFDGFRLQRMTGWSYGVPHFTFTGSDPAVAFSSHTGDVFPLLADSAAPYHATIIDGDTADYDVSSYSFVAKPETTGVVTFVTRAETYSVYWSTDMNTMLSQAWSTRAITEITLPSGVYPKSVAVHATRIFVLDGNNVLWWSKAGDHTTWHGDAPDGEFVAEDAGYWFVAIDDTANQIVDYRGSIFIFCSKSILQFSGYSPQTFALNKMFSGVGTYEYSKRSLCVSRNTVYFTYMGEVYEFNGSSRPSIISRPIIVGDSYQNDVLGGLRMDEGQDYTTSECLSVFADADFLYWYPFKTTYDADMPFADQDGDYMYAVIGMFDIARRNWWKVHAFDVDVSNDASAELYLFPGNKENYTTWTRTVHTTDAGITVNTNGGLDPNSEIEFMFKTKMFSSKPSDELHLSDIYIQISHIDRPHEGQWNNGRIKVYILDVRANDTEDMSENIDVNRRKDFLVYELDLSEGGFATDYSGATDMTMRIPVKYPLHNFTQEPAYVDDYFDDFYNTSEINTEVDTTGNAILLFGQKKFRIGIVLADMDYPYELIINNIELRYVKREVAR